MSNDLTKRAADMLLKGATLLAAPCPYCKGVRVMKDGNAFCVSCGREPNPEVEIVAEKKSEDKNTASSQSDSTLVTLAKKLESLSKELEKETDYEKQQQILKSINSLVEIIAKLRS
ncbi:MAG: hypothetical protein FJ360_00735 [Thaumarchaeota archaeon]|nr:hypothetical protein [Nitrososphaerota archaeon]